jgi:uracil-DNA glycosylase
MPMGFCYPGKGSSGDLPPRPECAPQWHHLLLKQMKQVKLTILIGQYSQAYYLGEKQKDTLTDTVKAFKQYLPRYLPLAHPWPRNRIWQKKNPWFEKEIVPYLQRTIQKII